MHLIILGWVELFYHKVTCFCIIFNFILCLFYPRFLLQPPFLLIFQLILLYLKPKILKFLCIKNWEGYAKGEHEYNASPTVESDEDENEIEDAVEPEDYDSDRCSDDQFACKNLDCISIDQRCDGTRHCHDGSDELNCAINKTGD